MPRYEVTAWIGTVYAEVDADDEDEALDRAQQFWDEGNFWADASYDVREVGEAS